ncbi:MAG: AraC family transcriptional regulator [Saprospiraceae bacterium]|nr:MAG: AraC family transcriptional regulator [Saprospiraceae bacterium]
MQEIVSVILLLGAAQGIFFSMMLLALPEGNRQANRWLAALLASFSINIAGTALYDLHITPQVPHIALIHTPFAVLIGISTWFFVKNFTEKNFKMRWWHWAHLLPFLLNVLYFVPFYWLSALEKKDILEASYLKKPDTWVWSFNAANLVNAVYVVLTVALILRHERHIRQVFSNTEKKSLRWLMQFIFAIVASFVVCVLLSVYDIGFADNFSNLAFSVIIYVMGYRAMKQPEIFKNIPEEVVTETDDPALVKTPVKYEKSGLTERKAQELLAKLDAAMAHEKVFLDPELTLPQLAELLGATPHQVSQLLNQHKQESFFDYVNRHRVEHFKRAALDPDNAHLSILGIAFDSGFNSKAAFNAVFKKMTGTTPSAFRKPVV